MGVPAALAAAGVLVAMALGAVSASAETVEFKPSASDQTFEVPAGVTQVEVLAVGGAGEGGKAGLGCGDSFPPGGSGAKVTATLPVGAGETLKVRFGGGGARGVSGVCEAGDGGGRSEVLTSSPLVVAGGGGGSGGEGEGFGDENGEGGSAKALVGDNGRGRYAEGGEGGSLSEGKGGNSQEDCTQGSDGVLETGGKGGGWTGSISVICAAGGGGGGGYRGGGGGGASVTAGSGGGAGSSFIDPSATTGEVASGASEAERVLITYTVPAACSMVHGVGHIAPKSSEGQNLAVNLNTSLSGIEKFTTTTPNGTARFILTHLTTASCEEKDGRYKFTGQGTARQFKEGGYEMAFAFTSIAGKTYLDLTVTDAKASVVYQVTHEPLTKGSKIKIS